MSKNISEKMIFDKIFDLAAACSVYFNFLIIIDYTRHVFWVLYLFMFRWSNPYVSNYIPTRPGMREIFVLFIHRTTTVSSWRWFNYRKCVLITCMHMFCSCGGVYMVIVNETGHL